MLAGFERSPCELEVCRNRGADIDHVDVIARDQLFGGVENVRDSKRCAQFARAFNDGIGNRDEFAALVAPEPGEVRDFGPRPGAEDSNADFRSRVSSSVLWHNSK